MTIKDRKQHLQELMTQTEAAELANCSFNTVQRAVKSGRLKSFRSLGGKVLVKLSDLENYMLGGEQ
ncbi:MAG: helix-turn-helix domain-containing protein [Lentisphaeraceae bacterium]|nr:helix-turn-helix domain-containing protein [Lentisphaeraceae bacterium]